jgi:hypothetical protein
VGTAPWWQGDAWALCTKTLQLWGSFLELAALFGEPGALGSPADSDGREDDYEVTMMA